MNDTYTYDENILSDLYKDAYGSRPGEGFWNYWNESTQDEKQEMWNGLCDMVQSEVERERQDQLKAEKYLEDTVIPNIQSHLNGCTREDAIRHLHETYETDGSVEYLEYHLGVRYGYLSGKVNPLYV